MTRKLIEDLILQFTSSTDVLDVPLFNEEMVTIWSSKTCRLHQDKENLPLYSKVSTVTICLVTAALVKVTHWNLFICILSTSFEKSVNAVQAYLSLRAVT